MDNLKLKQNKKIILGGVIGTLQKGGKLEFDSNNMWNWDESESYLNLDITNSAMLDFESTSNLVRMKRPSKITYFDQEFLTQLAAFAHRKNTDVLVVNDFLNMVQLKNIKKEINLFENINHEQVAGKGKLREMSSSREIVVLDRLGLILEIFNRRCADELMKIQVGLVYLKYAKLLLIRDGDTFSAVRDVLNFDIFSQVGVMYAVKRKTDPSNLKGTKSPWRTEIESSVQVTIASAKQRGGGGFLSGEGERQLEIERRNIKMIEKSLKGRLEKKKQHQKNKLEHTLKQKKHLVVALIGYTNAGKSALLNNFAQHEAMESRDQLFQTLHTVSRSVKLKGNSRVVMVDTIGFVMDLPHEIIPAFMTTLEHIKTADLILHIRDISHPQTEVMAKTVQEVLNSLNMGGITRDPARFIGNFFLANFQRFVIRWIFSRLISRIRPFLKIRFLFLQQKIRMLFFYGK